MRARSSSDGTKDLVLAPDDGAVVIEQVEARIARLRRAVHELELRFAGDRVDAASGGGEVVVAVDASGRLVGLHLAPGVTRRLTCTTLELLINETVCAAVSIAACGDRLASQTSA
jgi:YD repeat-containing protein